MKQEIFYGSHYEIGYKFGQKQLANGIFIPDNLSFPLTQERYDFAAACLPVYRRFFPELLAEIAGLAAGQNCQTATIQAVLFSMYALPPACGCSCLALGRPGRPLLGRNSDFLTALADYNLNVIYHFNTASSADFFGNTTAFIEMEDGVNAHGLALGLTSVAPVQAGPGFNAGLLLRLLLEKCQNTEQVVQICQKLPIASAHTLIAADKSGEIALLEMSAQRVEVIRPQAAEPFVCAVNQFSNAAMQPYQNTGVDNWQAAERWQTLQNMLSLHGRVSQLDLPQVQALLSGQMGFLCQYNRQAGHDTVWSVIYDLSAGHIYHADGNPGSLPFRQDTRFSW